MSKERELLQRLVDLDDRDSSDFVFCADLQPVIEESRALLAQPAWTDTPPSEPGWYWWRSHVNQPPDVLFGDADWNGDGTVQHWWNGLVRLSHCPVTGQWQGPIKPRD